MIFGADFNAVDVGVLALIALEIILGIRRGMAGTLFRLMCTLIVVFAGLRFYRPFGDLLARHTTWLAESPDTAGALAFLLICVALGVILLLVRLLLNMLLTVAFNAKINRAGGGIVGALQGFALVFLLVYAVGLWPQEALRRLFVETSLAGRIVFRVCPRVLSAVEQVEFRKAPAREEIDEPEQPRHRVSDK